MNFFYRNIFIVILFILSLIKNVYSDEQNSLSSLSACAAFYYSKLDILKIDQKNNSIQTQNILSLRNSKLQKLIVFDELTNYLLTVTYKGFKPLGKLLFPTQHSLTSISYSENNTLPQITNINFEYNKVERTNKMPKFPFKVPSKYAIKKL